MKRKISTIQSVRIVRPKIQVIDEPTSTSPTSVASQSSTNTNTRRPSSVTSCSDVDSESDTASASLESLSSDSEETEEETSDNSESDSEEENSEDEDAVSSDEDALEDERITILPDSSGTTLSTDPATGLTTLRKGRKPVIDHSHRTSSSALLAKLHDFVPQMLEANALLDQEREAGTLSERLLEIDADQEDSTGPYIEMNLGLGVLQEQLSDESEDEESDTDMETSIMSKLLPKPAPANQKVIIQEVNSLHSR